MDSLEMAVRALESLMSISDLKSDISKINNRTGPCVLVRPLTARIARFCTAECDSSKGFFDVTVAPLKYLYGLESHQKKNHVPDAAELDSVLRFIGCGRMRVLGDTAVLLDSGTTLDFGGIAKGYMLAMARDIFTGAGIKSFLVNLGGDLIGWGTKPGNNPWNVGIQNPRCDSLMLATFKITNTCMFTSGDYERFFIENGVRYHHLFDPHTGIPARKNQSATVIGPSPELDDVCVKVAFFMNAPDALAYLKARSLQGIIVDSAGRAWISAGLKDRLQVADGVKTEYR